MSTVWSRLGLVLRPLPEGTPDDPGLFGPDSIVWRIGRERALLAGGQAALLLQIAHPLVAAAVVRHSGFERDPFQRLQATLDRTLRIAFGDRRQATEAAEEVRVVHGRVRGTLAAPVGAYREGTGYDAMDPELALWVHTTLVITALDAFALLVAPLSEAERARYYEETRPFAALFGVPGDLMPASYPAFRAYVEDMTGGRRLMVGEDARRLSTLVLRPPVPVGLRPASAFLRAVSARLLPSWLAREYGLHAGRLEHVALPMGAAAARGALRFSPPSVRYWPHYQVARRRFASRSDGAAAENRQSKRSKK